MSYLHRAWADIDLSALVHNFGVIKNLTKSKIFSVVKANAYGHSAPIVAKFLDSCGTDYFAVSNIDEAKELRDHGIAKPILILGYTPPFLAKELGEMEIIQAVFSLEYAEKLDDSARMADVTVKAHMKLDTGMGRIGFDCRQDSLDGLSSAEKALSLKHLDFKGVFTHFPVADSKEKTDENFTREEFARFMKAVDLLEAKGHKFALRHCCNSAATLLYPEMHLDAIRPGVILYGLSPDESLDLPKGLKPVMTFKSAVSMVKTLREGETVNYGRSFSADRPMKVATVTAGYADGLPRLLSNNGYVLIKGQKAPIVGRICMDQFCADVSHIEGVSEGDEVILFGEGLPVEDMARAAGTINYEIVCGISKRVPRVNE